MSDDVHVVRVGGTGSDTVRVVRVGDGGDPSPGPVDGGEGGVTRPAKLDDLADVVGAAAAPVGATLVKGEDGLFHGQFLDPVDWWSGDGPPPAVVPGASPGDLYFDRVGKGLYRLS